MDNHTLSEKALNTGIFGRMIKRRDEEKKKPAMPTTTKEDAKRIARLKAIVRKAAERNAPKVEPLSPDTPIPSVWQDKKRDDQR